MFADDLTTLAGSEEDMQHSINILSEELSKYNMNINVKKQKIW